jgi:hypothetical protein
MFQQFTRSPACFGKLAKKRSSSIPQETRKLGKTLDDHVKTLYTMSHVTAFSLHFTGVFGGPYTMPKDDTRLRVSE